MFEQREQVAHDGAGVARAACRVLAACEAAVALAIILNLFNSFGSIQVDEADTMSG